MSLNDYLFDDCSGSFTLNEKSEDSISLISGLSVEKSMIKFESLYPLNGIVKSNFSFNFDINKNNIDFPLMNNIFVKDKTKNESNNKSKNKSKNETPIFMTIFRNKKRGRPNKSNKKRKEHCSSSSDNIIRKIQTHFLSFLIFFINDAIQSYFKEQKFKFLNLSHKKKSKVSFEYLNKLKNSTIEDIINMMNISDKYKCDKDTNKNNLKILNQITFFEKLFKIKFLVLFYYYYNDKRPIKEISLFNEKIELSEKTKTFYDLLQKNESLKKDIIEITDAFYKDVSNY